MADPSNPRRYAGLQILFVLICLGFFFFGVFQKTVQVSKQNSFSTASAPSYSQRFCDDMHPVDYAHNNVPSITITLHPGCYDGPYKLPLAWQEFMPQHTRNNGDWFSIWCNGQSAPKAVISYTQDSIYGLFNNCYDGQEAVTDFYAQGVGTITLRRLSTRSQNAAKESLPEPRAPDSPSTGAPRDHSDSDNASPDTKPTTVLTPTPASLGANPNYEIIFQQCVRTGEQIYCRATIKNTSDQLFEMTLWQLGTVDDQGNSLSTRFGFPDGQMSKNIIPNVPTRFNIVLSDPHRMARSLNFDLTTFIRPGDEHHTTFNNVPVQ